MTALDPTLPPVVLEMLRRGAQLEPIRLDRHGRWWHRGNAVEHARIAALFSRSIGRTAGGTWVLRIAPFTYPIEVDDTPLFVRAWQPGPGGVAAGAGAGVVLELSDGTRRGLEPGALCHADDGLFVGGLALERDEASAAHEARFLLEPYLSFVEAFIEPAEGEDGERASASFVVRTGRSDEPRLGLARRPGGKRGV